MHGHGALPLCQNFVHSQAEGKAGRAILPSGHLADQGAPLPKTLPWLPNPTPNPALLAGPLPFLN